MVRSSGSWRVVTRPGEARSGQSDYSAIATATSAGGTGCFSSSVTPLATALPGQIIPNGRTSCSYPLPYLERLHSEGTDGRQGIGCTLESASRACFRSDS
jgi:hypothetical protein